MKTKDIFAGILKQRKRERGAALAATLCLIVTAAAISSALLCLSQISTFDMRPHIQLQRSMYVNEGAANRIQWLVAADIALYGQTTPGETDYSEYDDDRYIPDGVIHELDYYGTKLNFTITDSAGGFDLSPQNYSTTINTIKNYTNVTLMESTDPYDELSAKIADYFDSNDDISANGMENTDYEDLKKQPLPRNSNKFFVREEYFWIPGFTDIFKPDDDGRLSCVRLYSGSTGNSGNSRRNIVRPNLFTATPLMLKVYCNLDDSQVEEVLAARKEWVENKVKMSDSLDPLLYNQLAPLSKRFGDIVTVRIEPAGKQPGRRLIFSYEVFDVTGPSDDNAVYLEHMLF